MYCFSFFSFFNLLFCVSLGQYLNLDKDHNGMLSKEELSRYGTATLTSVFLDRVFQECLTYDGEMVRWTTLVGELLLTHVGDRLMSPSNEPHFCQKIIVHLLFLLGEARG